MKEMKPEELKERLWRRYKEIREPWMRWMLRVQDEVLSALRDFLRAEGFIEILAPIVGPVTDPGIRGAKQVFVDYYGFRFKVMSSMILYKQMAINSFGKVFALSPNLRLEPFEALYTGRHLAEFRQLDLEVAEASYLQVMELGERMLVYVLRRVQKERAPELEKLGQELRIPSRPFKKMAHSEAVELLRKEGFDIKPGEEIPWNAEEYISKMFDEPFWIVDYPITARGFYDREDPDRPGILRDFDLLYPKGYGEAISGGEREYEYERILARMRARGDNPEEYGWYLEMLKDGVKPSAGFGIGIERLTRYLCGLRYIWDAVPFPKVPRIPSP